jgi:hypothetical protein
MRTFIGSQDSSVKKDKLLKFPSMKKLLGYFTRGRNNRTSIGEDFVHPTLKVMTPSTKNVESCTYFLTRSQQDEVRKQSSADDNWNENKERLEGAGLRGGSYKAPMLELDGTYDNTARTESSSGGRDSRNIVPTPREEKELDYSQISSVSHLQHKHQISLRSEKKVSASVSSRKEKEKGKENGVVKVAVLCCDKCDGKHETDQCPYYKEKREVHKDAQKNGWKLVGGSSTLPGAHLRTARIVPQAGDGSCLFHSMSYGIDDRSNACSLRREICEYIKHHPNTPICETPLSDWVQWDSGTSCSDYARRMRGGAWGGGIEMACMSQLKNCNVHVYERVRTGGFKRISAFDHHVNPKEKKTVRVLYRGGVHYDALVKTIA